MQQGIRCTNGAPKPEESKWSEVLVVPNTVDRRLWTPTFHCDVCTLRAIPVVWCEEATIPLEKYIYRICRLCLTIVSAVPCGKFL